MIGVIPAGGAATRLQPIPHSKEMTRVKDKPMIEYMIDKMRVVCDRIVVVTWPEKKDVINYVLSQDDNIDLVIRKTSELSESLISGFSLARSDEDIVWGLTDTMWRPHDAFEQLSIVNCNVLGLFPVDNPERFTVIESDENGWVKAVHGKVENPPSNYIWGIGKINQRDLVETKRLIDESGASNTFEEVISNIKFKTIKFKNGAYLDIGVKPIYKDLEKKLSELKIIQ